MSPSTEVPSKADLQEEFTAKIDERMDVLKEYVDEFNMLADMRARVTGKAPRKVGSSSAANGAGRAPHGQRLPEFIALVNENPGITIAALAEKMGVANNYLYRLRNQAVEQKAVRRDGSNLFPVAA